MRRSIAGSASTALGILLALASALGDGRLYVEGTGPGYGLWLRAREIGLIPCTAKPDAECATEAERLAVLIRAGNQVFSRVRETQDRFRWFVGVIEPWGDPQGTLIWPPDQRLTLVLRSGMQLHAREVLSSRGDARRAGPLIRLYPGGATLHFSDIRMIYPREELCTVYAAFPRAGWETEEVQSLLVTTQSEAGPDNAPAEAQARVREVTAMREGN